MFLTKASKAMSRDLSNLFLDNPQALSLPLTEGLGVHDIPKEIGTAWQCKNVFFIDAIEKAVISHGR